MGFGSKAGILATIGLVAVGAWAALSLLNDSFLVRAQNAQSGTRAATDFDSDAEWAGLGTSEVTLSDDPFVIRQAGTYVLRGTSNAGIVVNTEGKVRLVLDGVAVTNQSGAAIAVENADKTVVHLAAGSENYLEDSRTRSDAEIDGAVFSADDLEFEGSGKLSVRSNFADAIVSNDDLIITSGTYVIESVDDGIRGKDSLVITGGDFSIAAASDGIKSSNDSDAEKGYILIEGGSLEIEVGDDAIEAVSSITVNGGSIDVKQSLEGMEATNITINDGDIRIIARDDGVNAVWGGVGGDVFIAVNGGRIDVTVGNGDTDGFDSNGSIVIAGGYISVTAPRSAIDYEQSAEMTGGTLVVNGQTLDSIPRSRMGGFGRRRTR